MKPNVLILLLIFAIIGTAKALPPHKIYFTSAKERCSHNSRFATANWRYSGRRNLEPSSIIWWLLPLQKHWAISRKNTNFCTATWWKLISWHTLHWACRSYLRNVIITIFFSSPTSMVMQKCWSNFTRMLKLKTRISMSIWVICFHR